MWFIHISESNATIYWLVYLYFIQLNQVIIHKVLYNSNVFYIEIID